MPYHLVSRVDEVIDDMLSQGVIEEHPKGEHAPWVSNLVIAPKDDATTKQRIYPVGVVQLIGPTCWANQQSRLPRR